MTNLKHAVQSDLDLEWMAGNRHIVLLWKSCLAWNEVVCTGRLGIGIMLIARRTAVMHEGRSVVPLPCGGKHVHPGWCKT